MTQQEEKEVTETETITAANAEKEIGASLHLSALGNQNNSLKENGWVLLGGGELESWKRVGENLVNTPFLLSQ